MKQKTKVGTMLLFLGIFLVAVNIKVDTGISYGFLFGENEGIRKGGITYLTRIFLGDALKVDLCFNPVGYLCAMAGAWMLPLRHSEKKKMLWASICGIICSVAGMILPFVVGQYQLLKPVFILIIAELLAFFVLLYTFLLACKRQVDSYLYMEVGKDLMFALELYGCSVAGSYVMQLLSGFNVYFTHAGYYILVFVAYAAILYYIWKAWGYIDKLHLFSGKE